jgi:hypothetical protein
MLVLRRTLILAILWLFFECTISWLATCNPINQQSATNDNYQKHCTLLNGPVVSVLRFVARSMDLFLKEYEKEIIAGFTIVLACSTIGLWLATYRLQKTTRDLAKSGEDQIAVARKGADAALLNAEAVINAERAHLFVNIELENIAAMVSNAARAIGDGTYALRVSYAFKNYGRTPAIIREINHGAIIKFELPRERTYSAVVDLPVHILGAGEKSPPISNAVMPRMTTSLAESIRNIDAAFWFYGYVVYDDTFGWCRTLDFVWYYDATCSSLSLYSHRETEKRRDS